MGREIIIKGVAIKGNDKIEFYDGYTCGRDAATGYIQSLYNNTWKDHGGYTEEQIDKFNDFERAEYFSIPYILTENHDRKLLDDIMEQLQEYADADQKEIDHAHQELEDLKAAKARCKSFKSYQQFTAAIEEVESWLEYEDYSRAKSILDDIEQVLVKFDNLRTQNNSIFKYFDRFELWLESSE